MAEITRRRVGELVQKTFEILTEHPEGMQAKDVLAALERSVELSPFERSDYPNRPGIRRFDKIVRFATIAPVKAGWLVKNKGKWILTDEGKIAFKQFRDPEELTKRATELYRSWQSSQPDAIETIEAIAEDDTESPAATLEEAEELSWTKIEKYLKSMNPYDFQALVAALLKAMAITFLGFHLPAQIKVLTSSPILTRSEPKIHESRCR